MLSRWALKVGFRTYTHINHLVSTHWYGILSHHVLLPSSKVCAGQVMPCALWGLPRLPHTLVSNLSPIALVDHWRGTLPGRASATTKLVKKGRAKGGREGGSWEVNHDNLPSALKEKPQPDHQGSDETHYTPIVVSLRRSIET